MRQALALFLALWLAAPAAALTPSSRAGGGLTKVDGVYPLDAPIVIDPQGPGLDFSRMHCTGADTAFGSAETDEIAAYCNTNSVGGTTGWHVMNEDGPAGLIGEPFYSACLGAFHSSQNFTTGYYLRNAESSDWLSSRTINREGTTYNVSDMMRTQARLPFEGRWEHIGWTYAYYETGNGWTTGEDITFSLRYVEDGDNLWEDPSSTDLVQTFEEVETIDDVHKFRTVIFATPVAFTGTHVAVKITGDTRGMLRLKTLVCPLVNFIGAP